MKYKTDMRGFKEICLLVICLLQIVNLVFGIDYDTNREQTKPYLNNPQNPSNFASDSCKTNGNHYRNTREITDENPIPNLHSLITQDNLIKENSNRNVREISDSRIDTKRFDTGSEFDTNVSNEETEQQTCIRGNPGRNTRGISESMLSSNILNSIEGTCQKEHSRRIVRQVIGDNSPNILNQKVKDTKQAIGLQEGLELNKFYEDQNSDTHRNIRGIHDPELSTDTKLTGNINDDSPHNPGKLALSTNLVSDVLDGVNKFEKNIHRDLRDVSDSEQILNENFSNLRNVRDIDSVQQTQNLENVGSNQDFNENNHREIRGIGDQSAFEPGISNENLKNFESVIGDNKDRTAREVPVVDEAPMIVESQDFTNQNKLLKDSVEIGDSENLPKMTENDSFEDRGSLGENVRNTRDIVEGFQIGLNKDFLQDENIFSRVDENLETPSNSVLNNGGVSNENFERNSREIQGPSLLESDVSNQNMYENERGNMENIQIIDENRNTREIRDFSLRDSDVLIENFSENEGKEIVNNQRKVRETPNNENSGKVEVKIDNERNIREISDGTKMFRSNIFEENAYNFGFNSEKIEDFPENLDTGIFNDDESLVENSNIRNIREISDERLIKDVSLNSEENFKKKIREIDGENGKFFSNLENNSIDGYGENLGIPDLENESALKESKDEISEERRNIREISELGEKLESKLPERNIIEKDRDARDISMENRISLSKVDNQENIDKFRNIRELSGENQIIDTDVSKKVESRHIREVSEEFPTLPNSLNQDTIHNKRDIREISNKNNGFGQDFPNKPLVVDGDSLNQEIIDDKERNIREISLKNPNFDSNSINQPSSITEYRDIREVVLENTGFNSDNFRQEPVIIGENRNVREISSENEVEFNQNNPELKESIAGNDRKVGDIVLNEGGVGDETNFFNKNFVENEVKEEEIDNKREARSCKKKTSHHKNNSNETIHEKPEPVRASLQMMNLRIVKSKDDDKFSDDATNGEENEGRRKKKKICRVKNLHVLQPLKKNSKILESPLRKEENVRNSTMLKVLKATLDENKGEEEEGEGDEEEDEEKEVEEETKMRKDEEERFDENRARRKPAKKSRINNSERSKIVKVVNLDENNMKSRGRLEGRIISSPLVAENLPKRVFGGSKKFVLSENHPQSYVSKNRKSLFKKERFKNDDPSFLVGVQIKKDLQKEDDGNEFNDDFDDNNDVKDDIEAVSPGNFERLKLKDLQNFSEPMNVTNTLNNKQKLSEKKLNNFDKQLRNLDKNVNFNKNMKNSDTNCESKDQENFDKNDKQETVGEDVEEEDEEEGGGEGEEEEGVEEEESEEEDVGLKKMERDDENGEEESEMENDEFIENEGFEEDDMIIDEDKNN